MVHNESLIKYISVDDTLFSDNNFKNYSQSIEIMDYITFPSGIDGKSSEIIKLEFKIVNINPYEIMYVCSPGAIHPLYHQV